MLRVSEVSHRRLSAMGSAGHYSVAVTTTTLASAARARRSTIVYKLAMAVTGLVFIGYVLLHMYGNLKVFAGQKSFDEYAHHLRVIGEPILPENGALWIFRVVLLTSLLLHAVAAFTLWKRSADARGQRYEVKKAVSSTFSSRTMRWGGLTLLFFVVFHVLHLTVRAVTPGGDSDSPYERMVNGFQPDVFWVPLVYLLAMAALAMHLRHGVYSAAQTMGLTSTPQRRKLYDTAGVLLAVVVAGGFALVPLAVLTGLVE